MKCNPESTVSSLAWKSLHNIALATVILSSNLRENLAFISIEPCAGPGQLNALLNALLFRNLNCKHGSQKVWT